jgi:type II secretory pathway pseudopilin PulG
MALLEVIVAMTVFTIAAVSTAGWVRQTISATTSAQAATVRLRAASAYLDRLALWPREDLDRHLGERREGPYAVMVSRPLPTVYAVVLMDSTGSITLLQTSIYRPELSNATH